MEVKKNLLTYEGLKTLEDELHDLKVVKRKEVPEKSRRPESRAIFLRTRSMTRPRMSREILKPELKRLKRS